MNTNEVSSILRNETTTREVTLPGQPDEAKVRSNQQEKSQDNLTKVFTKNEEELTGKEVEEVVSFLNSSSDLFDLSLSFKVNTDLNRIVISVYDKETDEVVKQIPPKEIIDLAERLNEMVGVLFNETA
jgi:flagellar protein FlaG